MESTSKIWTPLLSLDDQLHLLRLPYVSFSSFETYNPSSIFPSSIPHYTSNQAAISVFFPINQSVHQSNQSVHQINPTQTHTHHKSHLYTLICGPMHPSLHPALISGSTLHLDTTHTTRHELAPPPPSPFPIVPFLPLSLLRAWHDICISPTAPLGSPEGDGDGRPLRVLETGE